MPSKDPADRARIARIAALTRHARCDGREATDAARRAFNARWEATVDPLGVLSDAERTRRAEMARRAYFTGLARRSAAARRRTQGGPA
jgi:hypothetical protein